MFLNPGGPLSCLLAVFGVELFVKGDQVWFSEVSPRPHDTGMTTMITQFMSTMTTMKVMRGITTRGWIPISGWGRPRPR